jgi:hypothetical protein
LRAEVTSEMSFSLVLGEVGLGSGLAEGSAGGLGGSDMVYTIHNAF